MSTTNDEHDGFERPKDLVGKKRKHGNPKNKENEENKKPKGRNVNEKDFKSIQEIFARIKGKIFKY